MNHSHVHKYPVNEQAFLAGEPLEQERAVKVPKGFVVVPLPPQYAKPPIDFALLAPQARKFDDCGERLPMVHSQWLEGCAYKMRELGVQKFWVEICAGTLAKADCVEPPGDYSRRRRASDRRESVLQPVCEVPKFTTWQKWLLVGWLAVIVWRVW